MRTAIALTVVVLVATSSSAFADHLDDLEGTRVARERRLSVATDPIGLFAGTYALSASVVASRRAAIRADVEIHEQSTFPTGIGAIGGDVAGVGGFGALGGVGYAAGNALDWRASISVPVYLDRALHGPYVEPGLALANRLVGYAHVASPDAMAPGIVVPQHERSVEPQIFVGWQWLFDSGVHIAGAIGVTRHFAGDGSGTSIAVPLHYLRVGFAL